MPRYFEQLVEQYIYIGNAVHGVVSMIEIREIRKAFEERVALDGIDYMSVQLF